MAEDLCGAGVAVHSVYLNRVQSLKNTFGDLSGVERCVSLCSTLARVFSRLESSNICVMQILEGFHRVLQSHSSVGKPLGGRPLCVWDLQSHSSVG